MGPELKILILEDSRSDAELIQRILKKEGLNCEFRLATNKKNFLEALDNFKPEIILSDNSLPRFNATEALAITKDRKLGIPFILVTGTVSEEFAADIIKAGANDYILKDRLARLPSAIKAALEKHHADRDRSQAINRLIRSEEKYRSLVERVSDGFVAMDQDWNITYINKVAEAMFGHDTNTMIGKNMWELFPEAVGQPFYHAYQQAMETQRHIRLEDYSVAVNRWVEANIYPSPTGISLFFRDITEQRKAEIKVRENEERYRIFLERITDAFIALDKNFCYTYINKQAGEMIHRDPSALIGMNVWEVFPDVVGSATYKAFVKAMKEQRYVQNIDYYPPLNLWQENYIYPSPDGLSIFIKDISESKRAEARILQNQMRLNQAQAIAHLGSWEIDFESGKSRWSDEAYRIYGQEPGDHNLSIQDWFSFVHPEDLSRIANILSESEKALSDIAFHHRIVRKDGAVRYIYSESKYEFNKDGKPTGLYGIAFDETESKLAEEELRKSNERFQFATRATRDIIWELNFLSKQYLVHEGKEKIFGVQKELTWGLAQNGEYIEAEDRTRIQESFYSGRMDRNCEFWEEEYRVISIEKEILNISNHAIFIRDAEGNAERAVGAITDITEKKKLEIELLTQQRNEQLRITATALEAQEKERNAIGQELHDNVNQIIAGTILRLSMASRKPEQMETSIQAAMDNLQEAIKENRKIAHALVAPDFGMKTLAEQITDLTNSMLRTPGIEVDLDIAGLNEAVLQGQQKLAVYRIAQEQCTNIIKYSKAKSVSVILQTSFSLFEMIIADDGVGMDMEKKTEGIGLRNIKGRLSVINGIVKIDSSPGNGFTLSIAIPIN